MVTGAQLLSYSFLLTGSQEDLCSGSFFLSPFFPSVFVEQQRSGVQRQVTLLLGHLGWHFNQEQKAPGPAGCNSLLVLPFPNQGETPHQFSETQIMPVLRAFQYLSSAGHGFLPSPCCDCVMSSSLRGDSTFPSKDCL